MIVTRRTFVKIYDEARAASSKIADATSPSSELPVDATFVCTADRNSGFAVTHDGTLIALFSTVKGRGDELIRQAVTRYGATKLDCFDGYLPKLYARHGFRETHREANWTPGGPDVVFMAR